MKKIYSSLLQEGVDEIIQSAFVTIRSAHVSISWQD